MERLVAHYLAGAPPFHTAVGVASDGKVYVKGGTGCALFGPFITLPPGRYTGRILLLPGAPRAGRVRLDVPARKGELVIREIEYDLARLSAEMNHIDIDFTIDQTEYDCEIRLICHENVEIAISGIEIAAHNPQISNLWFFRGHHHREDIKKDWSASPYYNAAEHALDSFWSPESPFARMFRSLDLTNAIELACGHGRHAAYIRDTYEFEHITLVDINEENIRFCRDRFVGDDRFSFLQNSGSDLRPLCSTSYTSLFCYDAMVHFEYDDVLSYLREIYRVLSPGGGALLHHSNYDANPGASYSTNPHWRNFMSARLFAHAAMRTGFSVIEQQLLEWGGLPALDCVTLLEKPHNP